MNTKTTTIPRAPLILGLLGLIPFLFGAYSIVTADAPFDIATGLIILRNYGLVILAFMSGVLWGFSIKHNHASGLALSVVPALYGFFALGWYVRASTPTALWLLVAGFAGLFALEKLYNRWQLVPVWWGRLRLILTTIVIACLALGALYA